MRGGDVDLRPHHIGITCGDLERSKAFYAALGFEPVSEMPLPDKTLVFMRLGELQVELFGYHAPVAEAPAVGRARGFKHLALECEDIDAAYRNLREAGVIGPEIEMTITPSGWRLLFFPDPDGMEIEIKER
jgi:catechol 2,3-dioxygenase-like lactoylglutathione lyase family enzyme